MKTQKIGGLWIEIDEQMINLDNASHMHYNNHKNEDYDDLWITMKSQFGDGSDYSVEEKVFKVDNGKNEYEFIKNIIKEYYQTKCV
jgi:hypothetical protein